MDPRPLSDATSRALRQAWFDYVAEVEPHRRDLFRYALRLAGDVFSAEDLVQEALLRGFASIGRGDLHGEASRVRNARAYLFRITSNLWVDLVRRQARSPVEPLPDATTAVDAQALTTAAAARLYAVTSPQERAAVVLKDVFDFTASEIADLLDTTEGAVKAALHRGRHKLEQVPHVPRHGRPDAALLARFVAAFEARDARALTECLLHNVAIEVPGVGGGRGRDGEWVASTVRFASGRLEMRDVAGWPVLLNIAPAQAGNAAGAHAVLQDVLRLEMADGGVARLQDYCYCPDLIDEVARVCGLHTERGDYHQPPEVLARMIASTRLPWHAP